MKKRTACTFGAGFLCAVLMFAGIFTAAAAATGNISFNAVNLSMDGQLVFGRNENLKLESGEEIPSSLMYIDSTGGGTTYLPLSYISKLLGVKVTWHGETKSVLLGDSKIVVLPDNEHLREEAEKYLVDGDYPKNSKGETYGPAWYSDFTGHAPDLILTKGIGKDGEEITGYIRNADTHADFSDVPLEEDVYIPLYDSEGNVIGTYRLDGVNPDEIESLKQQFNEKNPQ